MASAVLGKVSPTPKGEYVSTQDYDRLDVVTYEGYPYLAKSNVPSGNLPTDELYWMPLLTGLDFAPGGYGLGKKDARVVSDANDAKANGFYAMSGNSAINCPVNYANFKYGTLLVEVRYANTIHQTISYNNYSAKRCSLDDGATWGEWEYVNPPMQPGEEYRTTERWHGKVVYAKTVDFGNLPAPGEQKVITGFAPGIRYAVRVVPCYWFMSKLKNYQGLMNEVDKYYFSEGSSSESGRFTIKGASGFTYDPANWTCQIQAFYTKD